MPIEFEAGARFRIVDEATPVLKRLADMTQALNDIVTETYGNLRKLSVSGFGGLEKSVATLSDQGIGLGKSFTTAFDAMQAGAAKTLAEMKLVSDELRTIGAASAQAARTATGGGGHGGRGGALSASVPGIPLPGGAHVHGDTAALIAGSALAYGMYEESQFEDAAFRAMFTAGIPKDAAARQARFQQLRDIIQGASTSTGMPLADIEAATLTGIRQFAGMPWDQRMKLMPQLLQYAAAEARLKGSTTEEGMEALTGLAHMVKQYDPQQIANLASKFAYLSTVDPERMSQIQKAASYAVPILQSGLEVDPFETLLLVAAMQRGGATNTKAGTWIREMALRSMPGTSLMSKTAYEKHESALQALGLVDSRGRPTWFTDGKPDLIKMLGLAGDRLQQIPLTRRAALERQLFGSQGGGAFALLTDKTILGQIHKLRDEMNSFKSGEDFFEQYSKNSPMQQFRTEWADVQKVLMDIGQVALPPVVTLLQAFDTGLKALNKTLGSGMMAQIIGAGLGAVIGGRIAGLRGALIGGLAGGALPLLNAPPTKGGKDAPMTLGHELSFSHMRELWDDLVKSLSSAAAQKSSYLGAVPNGGTRAINVHTNVNMDGRKVAEIVTTHQVREGAGPAQGSPYHDPTYSTSPLDLVMV